MPVVSRTLTKTSTGISCGAVEEGLLECCAEPCAGAPPVGRWAQTVSAKRSGTQKGKTIRKKLAIGMRRGTMQASLDHPKSPETVAKSVADGQANRNAEY